LAAAGSDDPEDEDDEDEDEDEDDAFDVAIPGGFGIKRRGSGAGYDGEEGAVWRGLEV
jgi:hypothetical protein